MHPFPVTPLVRHVQSLVLQTFEVSEQFAEDYAAEAVALVEGWGRPETAAQLDWHYHIRKDLGEGRKLKWRSEEDRTKFEESQRRKYDDRNKLLNSDRPTKPFGTS